MATGDLLSIKIEGGYIGQTANNGQQIIDARTNAFIDWGIVGIFFEQIDDGSGTFTKQGNNVPGFLVFTLADGSVYKVRGEIDGVEKEGGKVELITFLALENQTIPITNGETSELQIVSGIDTAGSNFALDLLGDEINNTEFTVNQFKDVDKDGSEDDIQGSADLQSALGALNDQLSKQITVILSGDTVVKEGSTASIAANVENAPDTDLTINLSNGQSIVIKAGETSGSATFSVQADDPYIDPESSQVSIISTTGGDYYFIDINSTTELVVQDTIDETTVQVSATDATEASSTVNFSFALSNPPQPGSVASVNVVVDGQPYVVQLDADGKGSLEVINPNGEDVYKDSSQLTANVTSINGGNFEATNVEGASATAQIRDTIDETTVNLISSDDSVEVGNSVEISASVADTVTGSDLQLTLQDGSVLTIAVGENLSDTLVVNPSTSGVQEYSIASFSGGNFELLNTTDSISIDVVNTASYQGLSHGYWKNHGEGTPGKQGNDWDPVIGGGIGNYDGKGGDSFETLFGLSEAGISWTWIEGKGKKSNDVNSDDITFGEALALTGSGQNRLAREATAAIFNARDEDVNYLFSEEKIISSTYDALLSGDAQTISNLATIYENQNTLGL